MVPQLVRIARARALASGLQEPAMLQMPLLAQAAEPFIAVLLLAEHHLRKRQIDEPGFRADLRGRPDGGQLGRIVAERIVRRVPPRKTIVDPLREGGVNGHGQARAPIGQETDQRRGVARTFDEHGTRLDLTNEPGDMVGAGGAVMPDREIGDPPIQLYRRNQGSHFRAFSNSVHGPPCCLLRWRTTTSKYCLSRDRSSGLSLRAAPARWRATCSGLNFRPP